MSFSYSDLFTIKEAFAKTPYSEQGKYLRNFLHERNFSVNDESTLGPMTVYACLTRSTSFLSALLACNANLHWRDPKGNTLLYYAVAGCGFDLIGTPCNMEIVELLLSKGLSFDAPNTAGESPAFALWRWSENDPPCVGDALTSIVKRADGVLHWMAENTPSVFDRSASGVALLDHTPVERYIGKYPQYQQMEEMLQTYKSFAQSRSISSQLATVHTVVKRKM